MEEQLLKYGTIKAVGTGWWFNAERNTAELKAKEYKDDGNRVNKKGVKMGGQGETVKAVFFKEFEIMISFYEN